MIFRSATITYAQMAKRDNNRPPVRPICRRLGVNKLSEIKSDSDLYEAVCCYVFDGKEDCENDDIISERRKTPTTPIPVETIQSPTPVSANKISQLSPKYNTIQTANSWHPPNKPIPTVIYDENIPEFRVLLDCVLAVRISWDRYNRLDKFAHDFNIDQKLLLNCLKYVCSKIGCIRLDLSIDIKYE